VWTWHEQLKRRSGDAYLNTCMICRAHSFLFCRIQTPAFSDWLVFFACVCVRNIWRGVQAMFLNSCMIHRAPSFFFGRIQTLPFQTDRLFYCVDMCQEQLNMRWGNAYFNQCIISRAQSIFFWSHSDSCLFWPIIFVLACVCVRSTWRGVQAMPIWIHVRSATHDPFLCCHIQTPAFADRPFLFLRVNVSRAGEEAFRRCLFEYMSQSIFFGPHTDSCLVWQTILFPVCMCHGQLCQEHLKRRSGDAHLNTSMIRRAQSFFFGLIQTLAFSDRPFIKSRVYVSGAVE